MDFRFPGIDLNKPIQDEEHGQQSRNDTSNQDQDHQHNVEEPTGNEEQTTADIPMSDNHTGASAETGGIDTGDTVSTDDPGGDDKVQSTPRLTPVEKPYPDMLFDT
jgi:hypothetical protein